MIKLLRTAAFLLCTAVSAPVMAQDFDKGLAAYNVGDFDTALEELRPLGEQGHAGAQFNLGLMYSYGVGVPQDYAEAVTWYRLAAEQGDAGAQHALGSMYANGDGVIQDDAEAVNWSRLAADQGHAGAQYALGYNYAIGRGVIQDYAEAVTWYRLAAEQGHAGAQYALGYMYASGRGVPQDYAEAVVLAHMWFNIGGANGDERGSDDRGLIEEQMNREQIADAQARARRCLSSNYQDCG